mmetsp:Transcript_4771/g.11214  ORF Transcript_4771/g.11214 Transcript_4771/m.11214 type:complete len:99 (+) Transcript_4771:652-948(+)
MAAGGLQVLEDLGSARVYAQRGGLAAGAAGGKGKGGKGKGGKGGGGRGGGFKGAKGGEGAEANPFGFAGHATGASSYFDRLWKKDAKTARYCLHLVAL